MAYQYPEYLVSTEALAKSIESNTENLFVFDATVHLVPNPPGYRAVSGIHDYNKTHIPGARFFDLLNDFSDINSRFGFTLPSVDVLQAAFRKAGINSDSRIIFYSTGHMMWASRAWWLLHTCGHKNVAVLDGGLVRWQMQNDCESGDSPPISEGNFSACLNEAQWADKGKVLAAITNDDISTINALSPGVYSGSADMHYGRRGHIENSKNIYYDDVLDDGCFKSSDELEKLFSSKGVLDKPQVIAYCGGGISATVDALALSLIGHENVAVYDGSMSEWARDESLPLVEGEV